MLWEAITGRRLIAGQNEAEVIYSVIQGQVPPPSHVRADVPRALDAIVLRGLEKQAKDRYADAKAMATLLETAVKPIARSAVSAWVLDNAQDTLRRKQELVFAVEQQTAMLAALPLVSSEQVPFPSRGGEISACPLDLSPAGFVSPSSSAGRLSSEERRRFRAGRFATIASVGAVLLMAVVAAGWSHRPWMQTRPVQAASGPGQALPKASGSATVDSAVPLPTRTLAAAAELTVSASLVCSASRPAMSAKRWTSGSRPPDVRRASHPSDPIYQRD